MKTVGDSSSRIEVVIINLQKKKVMLREISDLSPIMQRVQ